MIFGKYEYRCKYPKPLSLQISKSVGKAEELEQPKHFEKRKKRTTMEDSQYLISRLTIKTQCAVNKKDSTQRSAEQNRVQKQTHTNMAS